MFGMQNCIRSQVLCAMIYHCTHSRQFHIMIKANVVMILTNMHVQLRKQPHTDAAIEKHDLYCTRSLRGIPSKTGVLAKIESTHFFYRRGLFGKVNN